MVVVRKMAAVDWLMTAPETTPPAIGARQEEGLMKIRSQVGMVLNLDKRIGCHTCSITCKNVWTSREGMEYAWFNNVEPSPASAIPTTGRTRTSGRAAGCAAVTARSPRR